MLMKKINRLIFLIGIILLSLPSANAFMSLPMAEEPVVKENQFSLTVKEFLELSPKKFETLTGKKMKLSQKISLKLGQAKIKKAIKKGSITDVNAVMSKGVLFDDFNLLGFILGFLLGPIGVLIAYVVDDSNLIKWAWLGFGTWALILLIAIIL